MIVGIRAKFRRSRWPWVFTATVSCPIMVTPHTPLRATPILSLSALSTSRNAQGLLDFDHPPYLFQLLLDSGRFLFRYALLDRLWCFVNQGFCLLQPQAGDGPHLFNNLDLFVP